MGKFFKQMKEVAQSRAEELRARDEGVGGHSKLRDLVNSKIRTSFIGAVSSIEEKFGYLWGQNKPISELSEEEKHYRSLWFALRDEILDKGNAQIRGVNKELDSYSIHYLGQSIKRGNINGNK